MIRLPLALIIVALALGASAPAAGPPLPLIEPGVRVLGVEVGGMTSEQARAKVKTSFVRPVRFTLEGKTWVVRPNVLGAAADVNRAVSDALRARPRTRVRLPVSIWKARLETYVARLARKYSYPAKNSELIGLVNLRPVITEAREGRKVDTDLLAKSIVGALRSGARPTIPLRLIPIEPATTPDDFGSIIVIQRESKQLNLYEGMSFVRSFPVATGQKKYPTPLGEWSIVTMQRDPWWIPPKSDWAKGLKPVPPGPGNPLGTRWMGLSAAAVGIHGTPDARSIGYSASHGCIRMRIPDAAWLFEHVSVGTPVYIVAA